MAKTASIIVRVDPQDKKRIEEAAARVGKSLTTFLLEAAMKAATKTESRRPPAGRHGGVPTFFAIHCAEARQGGANNYSWAAYHLAMHVLTEHPWDVTWSEWQDECARLNDLCADDDGEAIWGWFKAHYPRCMELVPGRRKQQFVSGVLQAYKEDKIL